jgi:heat shock protein HspQ
MTQTKTGNYTDGTYTGPEEGTLAAAIDQFIDMKLEPTAQRGVQVQYADAEDTESGVIQDVNGWYGEEQEEGYDRLLESEMSDTSSTFYVNGGTQYHAYVLEGEDAKKLKNMTLDQDNIAENLAEIQDIFSRAKKEVSDSNGDGNFTQFEYGTDEESGNRISQSTDLSRDRFDYADVVEEMGDENTLEKTFTDVDGNEYTIAFTKGEDGSINYEITAADDVDTAGIQMSGNLQDGDTVSFNTSNGTVKETDKNGQKVGEDVKLDGSITQTQKAKKPNGEDDGEDDVTHKQGQHTVITAPGGYEITIDLVEPMYAIRPEGSDDASQSIDLDGVIAAFVNDMKPEDIAQLTEEELVNMAVEDLYDTYGDNIQDEDGNVISREDAIRLFKATITPPTTE